MIIVYKPFAPKFNLQFVFNIEVLNLPHAVPHVVVTPNHKIILLRLYNCYFSSVMTPKKNIYHSQSNCDLQVEKHYFHIHTSCFQ